MRRVIAIIILLCISYFIGGYMAVHFEWITNDQYLTYAGIVGGLASVAGLFSFTRPPLTKTDIQALELDSFKSMVESAEQLKVLEEQTAQTKTELDDLEIRKKQMELLVKKASMALFLKEQHSQHEQKILVRVKADETLRESLTHLEALKVKLDALNEEIDANPNVETLRNVIKSANRRETSLDEAIDAMPLMARIIFIFIRELSKALTSALKVVR